VSTPSRTIGTITALVRILGLPRILAPVLLAAAVIALGGCLSGTDPEESSRIPGGTVTIYSSLPRHGVSAPAAAAAAAGQRLALADANGRAGGLRVRLVRLDSTEPGDRLWNPGRVSANAERAVDDDTAIAYIGELDYGASAVSVPITNDTGILQVSPGDGLTSLTRRPPGRPRAGPERYYPTGVRTFLRLVPNDLLQAETILQQLRARGRSRAAVVFDQEIYGRELAGELVARARRDGPEPVASEEYRGRVEEIPDIARSLAEDRPDAVVYAGVAGPGSGRLLAAIDMRVPGAPVAASAGLLARNPASPIPAAPESVRAYTPIRPAPALPASGRRILRRLRATEGAAAARPEAVYGYEAVKLVLDAISRAGPDRRQVIREALTPRERRSPLGELTVRATGDVDGAEFAVWALRDGRFEYERMIEKAP
jgi:branched-chain amino acid transport system substrate-binding protein